MPAPLPCTYTGDGFTVLPRFQRQADADYVIGEVYRLEAIEDRSDVSHKHEFGWLQEAWKNLPEDISEQFPSVEHLRKRALILGGFYHETIIDVGSKAAALRVAAYAKGDDEFAWVVVRGTVVVVRKAKSQARRKMRREEFQASKTAILEVVSDMLGVTPQALTRASGNQSSGRSGGRVNNPPPGRAERVEAA